MTKAKAKTPNAEADGIVSARRLAPGPEAARKAGCVCPVLDNEDMRGITNATGEPMYVVSGACPLHRYIIERLRSK